MPKVHRLFHAPKKRLPMEELPEARVLADFGVEGCAHARPSSGRQVLLVDRETVEAMDLRPGILRENITTDGLNVNSLPIGQRLGIGEVLLEVSSVCTPAI
jgi:MOSC domain-containing protein YiiM